MYCMSAGTSGLHGNYGLSDQEAVLNWVHAHISLVGGDGGRVTVGAERHGADLASLHLLSSSFLFQRMLLMVKNQPPTCSSQTSITTYVPISLLPAGWFCFLSITAPNSTLLQTFGARACHRAWLL